MAKQTFLARSRRITEKELVSDRKRLGQLRRELPRAQAELKDITRLAKLAKTPHIKQRLAELVKDVKDDLSDLEYEIDDTETSIGELEERLEEIEDESLSPEK